MEKYEDHVINNQVTYPQSDQCLESKTKCRQISNKEAMKMDLG